MAVASVCVFLSSSPGTPRQVEVIEELGRTIAERGLRLVYGGARRGLMGTLADAAVAAGGYTIGYIPKALVDLEVAHPNLSELNVVDTMHQRKAGMYDRSDAVIVAPGGFGTLEEAFEHITGLQLGYHRKPIVFLDIDKFWAPLEAFLDASVASRVLHPEVRPLFRTAPSPGAALDALMVA